MKAKQNGFGPYLMLLLAASILVPSAFGQKLPAFGNVVIVLGENQRLTGIGVGRLVGCRGGDRQTAQQASCCNGKHVLSDKGQGFPPFREIPVA